MEKQKRLNGQVALVNGGSHGIGARIVRRLASEGAAVAFTYAASEAKALQLVHEVETGGGRAIALKADSALEIVVSRPPEAKGASGYGVVMTLAFQAKRVGRFSVKITKGAVIQSNQ